MTKTYFFFIFIHFLKGGGFYDTRIKKMNTPSARTSGEKNWKLIDEEIKDTDLNVELCKNRLGNWF